MTPHSFVVEGLEITEKTARSLEHDGIAHAYPVQEAAIPHVLAERDVMIQSGTGTGKTLAYSLPLLQRLRVDATYRVLIIAPSPELAMQILRTVERYKSDSISSASLVGSGNIGRQKEKLRKKPRVVVGTPGRVLEMIALRKLSANTIDALVLDEIDRILTADIEDKLRSVLSRPEWEAQLIMASATFAPRSEKIAKDFMQSDCVRISLEPKPLRDKIRHRYVVTDLQKREIRLAKLIEDLKISRALVFVNRLPLVSHLFHFLAEHGIACDTLSSERSKRARQKAVETLGRGESKILIATDTAARGLDIKDLDWVLHYEIARDPETYLHRAGRTGRAGREGTSLTLLAKKELFLIKRYAKKLGIEFESGAP